MGDVDGVDVLDTTDKAEVYAINTPHVAVKLLTKKEKTSEDLSFHTQLSYQSGFLAMGE